MNSPSVQGHLIILLSEELTDTSRLVFHNLFVFLLYKICTIITQ